MGRYIAVRLGAALLTLLAASLLIFIMLRVAPGDPVRLMYGLTPPPDAQLEELRRSLGLDRSMPVQYLRYLADALQGDFGRSYRSHEPVGAMIAERFPRTLRLTVAGMLVAAAVGVTAGVVAGVRRGSWLDVLTMTGAVLGVSIPSFWFGILLILVFAVGLGWFSVAGSSHWRDVVLPALTLGIAAAAVIARVTRAAMIDVLSQDYIRTARVKGLPERVVYFRHALKNALIPVVSIVSLQVGYMLSGAIVVENVFGYAGMGQLAVYALNTRDFPVIQAVVLVATTCFVLVNLAVDLLYTLLDPRIRYA
ncbi:MAG TPA: ABC transporter permease [Bacillota bacterium]